MSDKHHLVTIRAFHTADADAVRAIASDTAQFGDPVELILNDRRLFADVFVRPYLDHCAATCWVAESAGHVVGYLTGCPDTGAFESVFRRALRRAALHVLTGRYRLGLRTVRAGYGYAREVLVRAPAVDLARYPAHLHMNVATGQRGRGIGRRLLVAYVDHCRAQRVPGVHLSTSDQNAVALHLYTALGFAELRRYHSPYKSIVSRRPVETVIMGLRLDS